MNRKVLMCLLRTTGTPGSEMVLFTSVTGQIRSGMALLKGVMWEYVEAPQNRIGVLSHSFQGPQNAYSRDRGMASSTVGFPGPGT